MITNCLVKLGFQTDVRGGLQDTSRHVKNTESIASRLVKKSQVLEAIEKQTEASLYRAGVLITNWLRKAGFTDIGGHTD